MILDIYKCSCFYFPVFTQSWFVSYRAPHAGRRRWCTEQQQLMTRNSRVH